LFLRLHRFSALTDEEILQERARAPERIGAVTPFLERAIAEEVSGLDALEEAVNLLE